MADHTQDARDLAQETRRAWTLQERLNKELDDLERSLSRMRHAAHPLPPDPHPGPTEPIAQHRQGG